MRKLETFIFCSQESLKEVQGEREETEDIKRSPYYIRTINMKYPQPKELCPQNMILG